MQFCFITFRSVTLAQWAEQMLRRNGFSCILRRTPRWMESQGCGYGLQVSAVAAQSCAELLHRNGISYRKIYLLGENDTAEELAL